MLELVFSGHQDARESEADGGGTFEPLQRRYRNGRPLVNQRGPARHISIRGRERKIRAVLEPFPGTPPSWSAAVTQTQQEHL